MASSQELQEFECEEQEEIDFDSLVNDTVQYILSEDHTKYPIKRQDIIKHVLKGTGRNFTNIIKEAKLMLMEIFGLNLVESDHSPSSKQYILVNSINLYPGILEVHFSDKEESQQVLLMLVLSVIFMRGGTVKEVELWKFLNDLELPIYGQFHEYFGDVQKLITQEFVRQAYLEHNRLPDTDPPLYVFQWGWRAEAEVSRRSLLDFVSKVYGNCSPTKWTTQYQEMLGIEERNVMENE